MKKKEKLGKVIKLFKEIDFSRLVRDLYTVDGFTEALIVNAIKSQNKGASIHLNSAFYKGVIEPFAEKLKEAGLLTVKKIGPTRYYTISDREKAIELFSEKKPEQIFLPVPAMMLKQKEEQQPQQQEQEKKVEEVEEVAAENPIETPSISNKPMKRGYKNDLIGLIAIMGCMYREKTQRISSSVPRKVLTEYGMNLKLNKPIADFNTMVDKQNLPFIIKKYGERRNLRYQIDVSPRKILKFLKSIGESYFPGDEEIARFLAWSLGKIDEIGKKPVEIKKAVAEEEPTKVKVEVPETKEPKTVVDKDKNKLWVITKMSLSEFKERYNVEAVELMTADDQTLLEAEVEDKKVIDVIKSELRNGEKCHCR